MVTIINTKINSIKSQNISCNKDQIQDIYFNKDRTQNITNRMEITIIKLSKVQNVV